MLGFWLIFIFFNIQSYLFFLFLSQLDVGDLKQQLAHSQTLFPENPSVWFKDLAGYLNMHLTAPDTGPTLSSYAHGPSSSVSFIALCTFYPAPNPSVLVSTLKVLSCLCLQTIPIA